MDNITQHDICLMSALLLDGLDLDTIGEKFEIPESDVIQYIYPPKKFIRASLFQSRLRRGTARLGEDCIEKLCPQCDHFYPLHGDFFHNNKNTPDGFFGWCRACEIDRQKEKNKKHT
ncbi:hypothetical protein [Vibrio sp. H11]|uniref:hypothetical protein n=1 Tax=Vibrio sp. H11 TaxID=2565928 RepID=UPI0010A61163|nr:hypothetical protein [Vibrio sp. H11]